MSIYSGVVGARLSQDHRLSMNAEDVLPRPRHALAGAIVVIAGCLALLILTVIVLARAGTVPSIQPLQQLLLGGLLPATASCSPRLYHYVYCRAEVDDKDIALFFITLTGTIKANVDSGSQFRLGDLLLAWGTPTGITRYGYGCSIVEFWGMRAVQAYTCV